MIKPRVSIVRGRNLKRFESPNYEPLLCSYDLTYYTTKHSKFDVRDIKIPVEKLPSPSDYFEREKLKAVLNLLPKSYLNQQLKGFLFGHYMFGLERHISGSDIVHTAEIDTAYSAQAARLKSEQKIRKLVLTVWENIPFKYLLGNNYALNRDLTIKQTDRFIAMSGKAKRALVLEGIPENKVAVVYMGVDLSVFKPESKSEKVLSKFGLDKDDFVMLSVGRSTWHKGHHELLFALKDLISDLNLPKNKIKLVIAGSQKGEYGRELEMIIRELNLQDNIVFAGFFDYDEIHELYSVANVFVHPSVIAPYWQEQFGWVLIEAMASGIPIVSTLSGSIPEVVGSSGILVPPGDSHSIYLAVRDLIVDVKKRAELAKKSRERAEEQFDCLKTAKKIDRVYQEVLHSK